MGKSSRQVLFEKPSNSGRIVFRFYDSGCLAVFKTGEMEPRGKNGEGGYLRFNNLSELHSKKGLKRLLVKLDELGPFQYPLIVEHSDSLYRNLLEEYLADTRDEPWLNFATYLSGLRETRGDVPYEKLRELVKRNEALLPKALELNALEHMIRPELGFVSKDLTGKRSYDDLLLLLEAIEARREDPIYSYQFERFENNVETRAVLLSKSPNFPGNHVRGPLVNNAVWMLTNEEYQNFNQLLKNASGDYHTCSLSLELSSLVAHTIATIGTRRAIDLLMFLMQQYKVAKETDYYYPYLELKTLAPYEGMKLTLPLLYEAVKNLDHPVEWALLLLVE